MGFRFRSDTGSGRRDSLPSHPDRRVPTNSRPVEAERVDGTDVWGPELGAGRELLDAVGPRAPVAVTGGAAPRPPVALGLGPGGPSSTRRGDVW